MKPSLATLRPRAPALCLLLWLPALPATADELPARVPAAVAAGTVASVVDGETLVLDGGVTVRLAGIRAPQLPINRQGFQSWPLADEARDALEALCLGRRVTLSYGARHVDRWRRLLARVRTGGMSLQEEMLRRGLARVRTLPGDGTDDGALYAAERAARSAKRGIWALSRYRILPPRETGRHIGSFQIVEGVAVAAAVVGGRGFVNFGDDWRTDFTISIAPSDMRRFLKAGIGPKSLAGKRIRVRGWLVREHGAMIRVTHPGQMEILDR